MPPYRDSTQDVTQSRLYQSPDVLDISQASFSTTPWPDLRFKIHPLSDTSSQSTSSSPLSSPLGVDGSQTPHRRSHARKRNATYIPRPPNAFMLYRSDYAASHPEEKDQKIVSKSVGRAWKILPEAQKDIFRERAARATAEHALLFPNYRYNPARRTKFKANPESARIVDMVGNSGSVVPDTSRVEAFVTGMAQHTPRTYAYNDHTPLPDQMIGSFTQHHAKPSPVDHVVNETTDTSSGDLSMILNMPTHYAIDAQFANVTGHFDQFHNLAPSSLLSSIGYQFPFSDYSSGGSFVREAGDSTWEANWANWTNFSMVD